MTIRDELMNIIDAVDNNGEWQNIFPEERDQIVDAILEKFDLAPKIEEGVIPWEEYAKAAGWGPKEEYYQKGYKAGLFYGFEVASVEMMHEFTRGKDIGPWTGAAAVMNRLNKKLTEADGKVWESITPDPHPMAD